MVEYGTPVSFSTSGQEPRCLFSSATTNSKMESDMMVAKISEFGFFVNPDSDGSRRYHAAMPKKIPPPGLTALRERLKANVHAAMEAAQVPEDELHKAAGYGNVYRLLNPTPENSIPQIDTLLKVANKLGVEVWQLLAPDFKLTRPAMKLANDWMTLSPDARNNFSGLITAQALLQRPHVADERVERAFGRLNPEGMSGTQQNKAPPEETRPTPSLAKRRRSTKKRA
jgi:hypothetical protein